jgi:hypothetical protein
MKDRKEGGKVGLLNQKGRKEEDPVFWTRKEGRRKSQSVGQERSEGGRSSLLDQKGRKEADPVYWITKGRKEEIPDC